MPHPKKQPYHLNGMEKDVRNLKRDMGILKNDVGWLKRLCLLSVGAGGTAAIGVIAQAVVQILK